MKIVHIFGQHLFAFKYKHQANEFERLFDFWADVEELETFFESNQLDLSNPYWGNISVEEAILKTMDEAQRLEDKIRGLSKQNNMQPKGLETLFRPLDDMQGQVDCILNKSKAKQSWLRIYALRIEKDVYVITGGAIKLTHKMGTRNHTQKELQKIDKCREYLIEQGIIDKEGLAEILEIC